MARTVLNVRKLETRNAPHAAINTLTAALDAADGAEFLMNERDDKYLILIENANASAEKSVTLKAGNGIEGVCDLSFSLEKSAYTFIAVDSARFKNVSGADKGKVILTGPADIKAAVFCLP